LTRFWKLIDALYQQKKRPKSYYQALSDLLLFYNAVIYTPKAQKKILKTDVIQASKYVKWSKLRQGKYGLRANSTVKNYIDILGATYNFLIYEEILKKNPFENIKRPNPKSNIVEPTNIFTSEQVGKLLALPATSKKESRDLALVTLLFATGLRRSEVINIRIGDLGVEDNQYPYVYVRSPKTEIDEKAFIPAWAIDRFMGWVNQRFYDVPEGNFFIFNSVYGDVSKPMSESSVTRIIKRYAKEIGVSHRVSAHSTRATSITQLYEIMQEKYGIADVNKIMKFARHRNIDSTLHYIKTYNLGRNSGAFELEY